jgi:signal transduction histidine kinase
MRSFISIIVNSFLPFRGWGLQPFFTTKPTGQGTGLGLSLAYDIAKAHSGDLRVETKEVEGSSFIISLPA